MKKDVNNIMWITGKLVKAYGNMRQKSRTLGLIISCTSKNVYVYEPLLQKVNNKNYRVITYTQREFSRFLNNSLEEGCFKLSKPPKQYLQRRTACNFVNHIYKNLNIKQILAIN